MGIEDIFKLPKVVHIEDMMFHLSNEYKDAEEQDLNIAYTQLLKIRKKLVDEAFDMDCCYRKLLNDVNETIKQELIKMRKETMKAFESVKSEEPEENIEAKGSCSFVRPDDFDFPRYDRHPYSVVIRNLIYKNFQSLTKKEANPFVWHYHGKDSETKNWMDGLEDKGIDFDKIDYDDCLYEDMTQHMLLIPATRYLMKETLFSLPDILVLDRIDSSVEVSFSYHVNGSDGKEDNLDWTVHDYYEKEADA